MHPIPTDLPVTLIAYEASDAALIAETLTDLAQNHPHWPADPWVDATQVTTASRDAHVVAAIASRIDDDTLHITATLVTSHADDQIVAALIAGVIDDAQRPWLQVEIDGRSAALAPLLAEGWVPTAPTQGRATTVTLSGAAVA